MAETNEDVVVRQQQQPRRRISADVAAEERARATYLVGGAALVGLTFLYLQFRTDGLIDVDAYYHIKWSRLLWDGIRGGAFPPAFTYLPYTTLNPQDYVDHHLLFHIFLIPFTWFGDLRLGAKVAAVLFGSLGVLSCYWLVLRYRINYVSLWLLALLAASAPFLYRMSMTRAQTLAIVFLIAGIYLLFEGRYRWLAPRAVFLVWYYSLFVLLCAAVVIWVAVLYWSERRFEWRPLLWTGLGTLAGFVVNPYFPKNLILFVSHVLMKVNPNEFSTSVGMEWYPYETWYFVGSCAVAFIATLAGYLFFEWEDKRRAARPLFFLVFSTMLLIANVRSRRFVEYWPPFAILFAAFTLQAYWNRARSFVTQLPSDVMDDLEPFFDRSASPAEETKKRHAVWQEPEAVGVGVGVAGILFLIAYVLQIYPRAGAVIAALVCLAAQFFYFRWRGMRKAVIAAVALLLCVPIYFNVRETGNTIEGEQRPEAYQGGAEWLRENAPPGEIIFNTDWDDFPKLLFYDSNHAYVSGLDPTYLLEQNPELSKLFVSITLAKEDAPAELIRDRFKARYVFTDNEGPHVDLQDKLLDSGWFDVAYTDESCTVLRLLDSRRATPAAGADEGPEEISPEENGG
jgi:hypothetical protein